MTRNLKKLIFAIAFILLVTVPAMNVKAGTIEKLEVTSENDKITVSGTVEEGVLAVAVMVYDSTGATLVKLETTSVNDEGTYTTAIAVPEGEYVVKVADYEGGAYTSATVKVSEEGETMEETTSAEEETSNAEEDTTSAAVEETTTDTDTETTEEKTEETTVADASGTDKAEVTTTQPENSETKSPSTGDSFQMQWIILLVGCAAVIGITVTVCKKSLLR